VRFFDVDDEEVGDLGAPLGQSMQSLEAGDERRSGAASERDDERPRASLEVEQAARRTVEREQMRVVGGTAGVNRFTHVEENAVANGAPGPHRHQGILQIMEAVRPKSGGVVNTKSVNDEGIILNLVSEYCKLSSLL